MTLVLIFVGLATIYSGPAFDELRRRRRERRDYPTARVTFLLPSECRRPE